MINDKKVFFCLRPRDYTPGFCLENSVQEYKQNFRNHFSRLDSVGKNLRGLLHQSHV